MADDLEKEKWQLAKAMFGIMVAQQILICGLSKMQSEQWEMLCVIGKELGIKFSAPPPIVDPETMAKAAEGVRELEALFNFDKPDEPVN